MSTEIRAFLAEFGRELTYAFVGAFPGGRLILDKTGLLSSSKTSVDERLRKIEVARSNLSEALEAIDDLKSEAEKNSRALADLTYKLSEREREKGDLDAKLNELRTLTDVSAATVQSVFRVPTRASIWAERAIGFLIGVGASVVASIIYSRLP